MRCPATPLTRGIGLALGLLPLVTGGCLLGQGQGSDESNPTWVVGHPTIAPATEPAQVPLVTGDYPRPTGQVADGGFLSREPCGPPCFWGIVPSQTSEDQLSSILAENPLFSGCNSYDSTAEGGYRGISCPQFGGSISHKPGGSQVECLGFSPDPSFTLGDAVSQYGQPDGALVVQVGVSDRVRSVALVYYDEILTRLRFSEIEGRLYALEPTTIVEDVLYCEASLHMGDQDPRVEPWVGYGEYRVSDD